MPTTIFTFFIFALLYSQTSQGVIVEDLKVSSKILGKDVNYTIYLPPDYETSERYYPVVYLLHGYTDDDSGWLQFGELNRIVDKAIAFGDIPPMIIVMPDGEVSWYINDVNNKYRWKDMFVEEFIPAVENTYRIRKKKEFRGVAGLSMGGYGSFVMGLLHPELFVASAPLSAGVVTDQEYVDLEQERYEEMFGFLFGVGLKGKARINDHYKKYSPLHIVASQPADSTARVQFYIDCGDDDFLTIGNAEMHILMTEMEIPHEYRVRDGSHEWEYWRTGLTDALKFIGKNFRR